MKKQILLLAFGMTAFLAKAQVVFNVQSPANLVGNYTITFADPGGGWGNADLIDPLNSVTGNLVMASDGTAADSLACNALVNGAQIAGNIAVVYRGSCQFGVKALNAQDAGAIAVVIINNAPGDPIGMAPGDVGANVTIPVVMLTQIDGAIIAGSVNNGDNVSVFIGNKFGLFDTDLGFTKDRVLLPNPNSNVSLLAQNGTEHNFRIGSWVYNFGNVTQTDAMLSADITFNGSSIYSEQIAVPTINSGDTLFVELPVFSPSSYAVGTYNLTYTLTTGMPDEYDSDNIYSTEFSISDFVYSYAKLNANGKPNATTGYRTSTATTTFSSCIHFKNNNASRVETDGIYFAGVTNTSATLLNQEFIVTAYEWNDVFTDLNDAAAVITDVIEITQGSYIFTDSTSEFLSVFAPFSTPVQLIDNQRYLFCVTTYDVNTYIGFGDLDYSLVLDEYLQPLFPIQTDAGFNIVGFGGEVPAIGINMYEPGTAGLANQTLSNVNIYPNPSKDVINISGHDLNKFNTIELKDQLGRTVSSWKVNSNSTTLNVSNIATGNYLLVLSGNSGVSVNKVQINK